MDNVKKYTELLGNTVQVSIDRPIGSKHPRLDFIYETNYGFIPDTLAGDGHEIDAYVLGEDKALSQFKGSVIAVIVREDDNENKLVVAKYPMSLDQIQQATKFVEQYYSTEYILAPQSDSD